MSSSYVEFPIKFKGDTEPLKEELDKLKDTEVKVKVDADTKGFEKGNIEGFLKQVQELTARLANGGLSKGFGQLKEGASAFVGSIRNGEGAANAFSAGIHKIGVEGLGAIGVIVAILEAVKKTVTVFAEAHAAIDEFHFANERLGGSLGDVLTASRGLLSAQDALAQRHASLASGIRLTSQEQTALATATARYAQILGNAGEANSLVQQAMSGNADAARRLNVSLREGATGAEVARATLQQLTQQNQEMGPAVQTATQAWEEFKNNLSTAFQGVLAIGTQLITAVLRPVIDWAMGAARSVREFILSVDEGLRSLLGGDADQSLRNQIQRYEQAQVQMHQTVMTYRKEVNKDDRQRIVDLQIQGGLLQTQLDRSRANVGVGQEALTLDQAIARVRARIAELSVNIAQASGQDALALQQSLVANGQKLQSLIDQRRQRAETATANRIQLEDARFQLVLDNDRRAALENIIDPLTTITRLQGQAAELEQRIATHVGNRPNATMHQIEALQRLRTHLEAVRDVEREITEAYATQQTTRNADEKTAATNRLSAATEVLNKTRQHQQLLAAMATTERGLRDIRLGSLQAALQAEFSGQALIQSQMDALEDREKILNGLQTNVNQVGALISSTNAQLAAGNLTEERRNELLAQRNQLVQTQIGYQQQLQQVEQALNGPSFNQQLGQSVRSLSGEYRSASSVMGGVVSSALGTMTSAFKSHLQAVITGKETIGQALQGIVHETMLALATESAAKAIFNLAEAAAAAATYRPAEAAQHLVAAGLYTAVAGVSGGIAAATVPSAASSGASTGPGGISGVGNSSSSNREDTPGQNLTVNILGAMYLTREQVEDAIVQANRAGLRRTGENRASN